MPAPWAPRAAQSVPGSRPSRADRVEPGRVERPGGHQHGRAGQLDLRRRRSPRATSRPPGTSTVHRAGASGPTRRRAAAKTAHAPVPHDCVSPTPRSCTRMARGPARRRGRTRRSPRPGTPAPAGPAERCAAVPARPGPRRTRPRAGCPCRRRRRAASAAVVADLHLHAGPDPGNRAGPISHGDVAGLVHDDARARRPGSRCAASPARPRARRRRGSARTPARRCRTSRRASRRRCGSP